jgi:transcriptional regulator with XRE-family HTH domain
MMIGNKLLLLRIASGLTQDQFAKYLGMSRTTYNPIELNRLVPTSDVVRNIEQKLGIKLDDPKIEQFMSITEHLSKELALAA